MNNLRNQEADQPSDPERDGRAGIAARITASRTFARSPRLCSLLSFLMEQYLSGRSQDLTEQNIAAQVFGRVRGFDPSSDNIVRVSMRQLRAKIREYYEEEGHAEEWIAEIPKGGYVPLLRQRAVTEQAEVPSAKTGWQRMQIAVLGVLLTLLGAMLVTVILLWRENARLKPGRGPVSTERSLVAEAVLNSGQMTIVVPPDSGVSLMELLAGRNIELPQYTGEKPWPVPSVLDQPAGKRLWEELQTRNLTHASLFSLVQTMERQNPNADIVVRHPRTISARDFKNGNFVLLGMTNPWIALFEPKLNFVLGKGYPHNSGVIRNLSPAFGEPAEYRDTQAQGMSGASYARVALVPNLSGTGRVLLMTGLGTYKTEAAGEFLLRRGSAGLIRQTMDVPSDSSLPGFELILEAKEVNRTGISARIIAWRLHK